MIRWYWIELTYTNYYWILQIQKSIHIFHAYIKLIYNKIYSYQLGVPSLSLFYKFIREQIAYFHSNGHPDFCDGVVPDGLRCSSPMLNAFYHILLKIEPAVLSKVICIIRDGYHNLYIMSSHVLACNCYGVEFFVHILWYSDCVVKVKRLHRLPLIK